MKAIISLSGGLDSTTLLAAYENQVQHCVFFYYGSKQNERELQAVNYITRHYYKPLTIIDARGLFKSFKSALLSHSSEEIEKGPYDQMEVSNAKVPFRNGIFASTLVGLAESLELDTIMLAVHAGDHRLYPDCTPSFFKAFGDCVNAYSNGLIDVYTPFIGMTKAQIAALAKSLNVPLEKTFSCYNSEELHCGECPTCIERKESIGINDPTKYKN